MESHREFVSMDKSDSKVKIAEKRSSAESGTVHQPGPRKRVKIRDLESVCRSDGINFQYHQSSNNKEGSGEHELHENNNSQVPEGIVRLDSDVLLVEKAERNSLTVVDPEQRQLDLNVEMCISKDKIPDDGPECSKSCEKSDNVLGTTRGIRLGLNSEDVSSSMNQDPFFPYKNLNQLKARDISECASSTGPLGESDSLRVWKEMKQNGFLSSSHGGIPIPKQRGRKSKTDLLKKKMEIAKREQVDRFTKIAAPSELLNELNPGIINHVRNRKQVHSIIEALVRSEKHETDQLGCKQTSHSKSATTEPSNHKGQESSFDSAMPLFHDNTQTNTVSWVRQARGFPTSLVKCPLVLDAKGLESGLTAAESFSLKTGSATQSTLASEEETLALKLSSTTKMSENESTLSNDDSASYLSVEAATVASQWLELLHQDIKGRLSALRRSKKRVQAVISTELPFLLSKEFAYDQENDLYAMKASVAGFSHSAIAEIHQARWCRLFDQMDKSLAEEERQLECWLNQVKEMQLHCDKGLRQIHCNTAFGTSDGSARLQKMERWEGELAVRAAAASIYSTCNFLLSK